MLLIIGSIDLFAEVAGDDYDWDEHDLVTLRDRHQAIADAAGQRGSRAWKDAHYASLA